MMRQLILLTAVLLTGCGLKGPFANRSSQRVDDPRLPIYEQEYRGRDRLAYPEQAPNLTPRTYVEFPGPHGR
jgi:hypothetical protein